MLWESMYEVKKKRHVYHNINHKIIHKQNELKELYFQWMSKKQELWLTFLLLYIICLQVH